MRLISACVGLIVVFNLFPGPAVSVPTPMAATESAGEAVEMLQVLTSEQRELVAWAEGRFDAAGLDLPEVGYVFHEDTESCGWHRGLYHSSGVVEICNANPETILHELAHAWAGSNVTGRLREGFMQRRHLTVWNDHTVPWSERATEHAAEVIAWGVEEESRLVVWVGPDGDRTFRLLTIPDSSPDELLAEYELLTGLEASLRSPAEWEESQDGALSPESQRMASWRKAPATG